MFSIVFVYLNQIIYSPHLMLYKSPANLELPSAARFPMLSCRMSSPPARQIIPRVIHAHIQAGAATCPPFFDNNNDQISRELKIVAPNLHFTNRRLPVSCFKKYISRCFHKLVPAGGHSSTTHSPSSCPRQEAGKGLEFKSPAPPNLTDILPHQNSLL